MELSDEKIWIYGLLKACPEKRALSDCPLEKYRKLPEREKLSTLENFTEEEVKEIIKQHNQCLLRRV